MTDDALIDAWARRSAAYDQYNALPHSATDAAAYSPDEQAQWDIIDAAEAVICSTIAKTPEGVAVQLWTQLSHRVIDRADDAAAFRRDLPHFEALGDRLDWTERLTVAALKSLSSFG